MGKLNYLWFLFIIVGGCTQHNDDTLFKMSKTGKILIGTDATYPPFESRNTDSSSLVGFDIDLITEVCNKLNTKPEFVVVAFDGIIPALQEQKYDMIISAMTITEERSKQVTFSIPYYNAGQSIAVCSDSKINAIDDLIKKRIGVQLGTTGEIEAKKIQDTNVVSYDDINAAFIDLQNKKIDAVINDHPTNKTIISLKTGLKIVGSKLTNENYGIAMRRSDIRLISKVNKILEELISSGWVDKLKQKWEIE